ncbi:MAG: HU family DNA-binding protein [Prevotellaceae bacterium]|jgi:predicted histone-like DNA-binding protein|nr:HU family DNA-binding protein [Prevotellaceae bacterium]
MSIKYKTVQKVQPGVAGGGNRKYYASIVTDGEVSIDELVKEIEKFSALSEPDIRGVIIALENVIQNKLAESKIVRLDKLGSFYPTLSSEGKDDAKQITASSIKKAGINYRPGERIIDAINAAGFKKIE